MPKTLIRFVTLLLIPTLALSGIESYSYAGPSRVISRSLFQEQALTERLSFFITPLNGFWRVKALSSNSFLRWIRRTKEEKEVDLQRRRFTQLLGTLGLAPLASDNILNLFPGEVAATVLQNLTISPDALAAAGQLSSSFDSAITLLRYSVDLPALPLGFLDLRLFAALREWASHKEALLNQGGPAALIPRLIDAQTQDYLSAIAAYESQIDRKDARRANQLSLLRVLPDGRSRPVESCPSPRGLETRNLCHGECGLFVQFERSLCTRQCQAAFDFGTSHSSRHRSGPREFFVARHECTGNKADWKPCCR
jgi:hypothetical protein